MIKTILWDVDGTLLDFGAAERAAILSLYRDFGLGTCTEDALRRYSQLNKTYWERLERREITKPELLVRRFQDFFGAEGLSVDAAAFNAAYQTRLGETAIPRDDSVALVTSLRGRVRQYVVSNGTVQAQTAKLRRSGLDRLMDGIFLSERIGAEKPDIAFFRCRLRRHRPGGEGGSPHRGGLPHQRHPGRKKRRHPDLLVRPCRRGEPPPPPHHPGPPPGPGPAVKGDRP